MTLTLFFHTGVDGRSVTYPNNRGPPTAHRVGTWWCRGHMHLQTAHTIHNNKSCRYFDPHSFIQFDFFFNKYWCKTAFHALSILTEEGSVLSITNNWPLGAVGYNRAYIHTHVMETCLLAICTLWVVFVRAIYKWNSFIWTDVHFVSECTSSIYILHQSVCVWCAWHADPCQQIRML